MKNILSIIALCLSPTIFSQTCNLLNHNCSNTSGLNTSGVSTNGGSTIACVIANSVLYSSSTNAYIATGDLSVSQGNAVTLNFEAKRSSSYSGTCEIWVHVGGYCSFAVYTTPFNTNGWVQIGTFNPTTTCSGFGPFTVPSDVIGGQNISYCIVLKNASSSNWVSIDDICVSQISGSAVPTTYNETFGTSSSGWYPSSGYIGVPYHTYKNASDAYVILGTGEGGGSDKAAYFYTGFDFCSTVSGTGIVTKEINTSGFTNGEIRLSFKSQYPCAGPPGYTFDEDYTNYAPEVYIMTGADFGGNTWTQLPVNYYFADYAWRVASYDISAYQNANIRIKIERGGFCSSAMEAVDNIKIIDRNCSISLLSCGTITGETAPLPNTSYPYSVPAVTGATYYKWYVRDGGILYDAAPYIVSGQGTQNVMIDFNNLPSTGVRVLCIPFDVDPSSDPDACYAQIGYLGVTVAAALPLSLDNVDSTDVTCFGFNDGSITLTVSDGQPAYTYTWVPNVSSSNSATGLSPGLYQITVEDQNADQIVVNVTINEPPEILITGTNAVSMCAGDTYLSDFVLSGGAAPYLIGPWTPGTGVSNPFLLNPFFNPTTSTLYTLNIVDASGCSAATTLDITVNQPPVADFFYGTYCANDADPFPTFISGGTAGTFSSDPGLVINSTTGEVDLDASTPGIHTITNTVISAGCPTASFSADITIFEIPDATISGSASVCQGTSLPDIIFTITSGMPPWNLTYNLDGSPIVVPGIAFSPYTIAGAPGIYDLVSITDGNGCTNSIAGQVVQEEFPIPMMVSISDTSVWAGDNVVLNGFSTVSVPSTFTWINLTGTDIGFGLSGSGDIAPFTAVNVTGSEIIVTIEVTPVSSDGCTGAPITFTIRVYPPSGVGVTMNQLTDINIYPNPVSDNLIISNLPLNSKIELIDLNGKRIRIGTNETSEFSYNTELLARGTYTVIITVGDNIIQKKFVKN